MNDSVPPSAEPASFELDPFMPQVTVTFSDEVMNEARLSEPHEEWKENLDRASFREFIVRFPAFEDWINTLKQELYLQANPNHPFHNEPYSLKSIKIQSVDLWGKKEQPGGFIKISAKITNKNNNQLPGIAFLRGGSVAVLIILWPEDEPEERYVVMTVQPRIPAASLTFWEIPAGMLDGESDKLIGKAVKEVEEETGLRIPVHELCNLTELALGETLVQSAQRAMYPSPGGSDEFIPLLVWEKSMPRMDIVDLQDKLTGNRRQGEMITVKLVQYEDVWKEGGRDAKTLAAWALYEKLKQEGFDLSRARRS